LHYQECSSSKCREKRPRHNSRISGRSNAHLYGVTRGHNISDKKTDMSAPRKTEVFRCALALMVFLLATGTWSVWAAREEATREFDEIAILVPDSVDFADPMVRLWLDAASEEGLHVVAMYDSDFLRLIISGHRVRGAILPDTIHRSASDVLVDAVSRYVEQGGSLLLVGDVGVLNQKNVYPRGRSRFSRLAGIEYGFYDELRDKAVAWGEVWGSQKVFNELHVPPGVGVPGVEHAGDSSRSADPSVEQCTDLTFTRYGGGDLVYPTFLTRGTYDGRVLLRSPSGVAAGLRKTGNGEVLYVNLLLGYLKTRTDGLLLHLFLNYFATSLLQLPSLTAVPAGIGGMVMNWHLDSNAALAPLETMRKAGIFEQGPYSIHLTAGPDTREFGDRLGLNVDGDPAIQEWIRYFSQHGHAIGSHGGWIHDYFGLHVSEASIIKNDRGGIKPSSRSNLLSAKTRCWPRLQARFAPRKKGSNFAPLCVLPLSALPAGSPSGSLIVWQLTPQWKLCHWK
jgi:hypothetical protein